MALAEREGSAPYPLPHYPPPRGVKLPRGFLEFHRGDTRDPRPVQPPKANSVNVERGDC